MTSPAPGAPRLLVVSDTLTGGEGALAAFHADTARRAGWAVAVAAPGGEADAQFPDTHHVLPLPATARDGVGLWRASRSLARVVEQFGPDVVHCHGARCFAATRLAGGPRPFVSLHGIQPVSGDPLGYRAVRRAGLGLVPRVAAGAFDDGPNGLPGWRFVPHASPALATLPRLGPPAGDRPTFVWLGRLDEPKQPALFVHALADLARHRPEVRGIVAGSGPLAGPLAALAQGLGAPIEFRGHCHAITDVLAEAWAVTLFSTAEGVPLSLQEAMWARRAVVASPLPGIRFLAERRGGILAGEVGSIVAALGQLCDRAEAARMGDEAADEVRTKVEVDDPWPALAQAYGRVAPATREAAWR